MTTQQLGLSFSPNLFFTSFEDDRVYHPTQPALSSSQDTTTYSSFSTSLLTTTALNGTLKIESKSLEFGRKKKEDKDTLTGDINEYENKNNDLDCPDQQATSRI